MKKAFSTVACMGLEWQRVLSCAVDADMNAVEIRMDNDGRIFGLAEEQLPQLAKAFAEKGVKISNIGTSILVNDYAPEKLEAVSRCAAMAHTLGAKGMRVFLGNFVKRFSDAAHCDEDGIARFLQEAADCALAQGVEIWIETHNEYSTGRALRRLLDKVNRANVRVIWDILHPYEFGETPEDTFRLIGRDIVHVHIKDGTKPEDPDWIDYRYTRLGEGDTPIWQIMDLLEKAEYQGYYSLEWENAWRPEIQRIYENLDQVLAAWNGFLSNKKDFPA